MQVDEVRGWAADEEGGHENLGILGEIGHNMIHCEDTWPVDEIEEQVIVFVEDWVFSMTRSR